jgi:hypothetical protein
VALAAFIDQLPHIRRNGPSGFILEAPPARWMNISLEVADPHGDSVAVDEAGGDQVNCIRLHIPHANLGQEAERDYFPLAFDIAQFVGWQVYDAQSGAYVTPPAAPDPTRGDFAREVVDTLIEQPAPAPVVEAAPASAPKPAPKPAARPKKTPAAKVKKAVKKTAVKKAASKSAKPAASAAAKKKPAAKGAAKQKKTAKAKPKPAAARAKAKPARAKAAKKKSKRR